MAKLDQPFSYKNQFGVQTLLGRCIKGNGVVLQRPDLAGRLVLLDHNRTLVNRTTDALAWQQYEDHLTKSYANAEVRRHINKALNGGTQVFASKKGTRAVLEMAVNKAVYRAGPSHLKIMAQKAWINMRSPLSSDSQGSIDDFVEYCRAIVMDSGIVDGSIETLATITTVVNDQLFNFNVSNLYTPAMYPKFYNGHGAAWTGKTAVEAYYQYYKPGYTVLAVSLDGSPSANAASAVERAVILRFKHNVDFPYAWLSFKFCWALSGSDLYAGMNVSADYWSTVVNGASTVPALVPGEICYGSGDYAKMWKKAPTATWFLLGNADVGTHTQTSVYLPTPTRGFGITYVPQHHFIPGVAQGANWPAFGYGSGPFGLLEPPLDAADAPGWPGLLTGDAAKRESLVNLLEKGVSGISLGYDMSSTPLAQLRYEVDIPLPNPSAIELAEPVKTLRALSARWRSADLIYALESLELQSGSGLQSLKADLVANPRVFLSAYDHAGFRIPYNVVYQTSPAIMADDEGFDIDKEILLEKDVDDVDSKSMTFAQANVECNKLHSQGMMKSIVVPGPVSTFAPTPITSGWGYYPFEGQYAAVKRELVDSVMTSTRLLTDEELSGVYVGLQEGGTPLHGDMTANADYMTYASEHVSTGYPLTFDYICLKLFGKTYGQMTKNKSAGAVAREWCADGNMSRGFIAHPSTWTNEFCAITGAGKSYRAAGLVGSLMTNPFGFGTIGTQGHTHG